MKKTLRILCVIGAFLAMSGTASCGGKKSSESIAVESVQMSLKTADINIADNFSSIRCVDMSSPQNILIFGQLKTGGWSGFTTDSQFNEYTEFSIVPEEGETILSACLLKFGKKAVLTCTDEKARIYVYSADDKKEKIIECDGLNLDAERGAVLFGTEDGFLINVDNQSIEVFDSSGKHIGTVSVGGDSIYGMSRNIDGGINVFLAGGEKFSTAQIQGLELINKQECGSMSSSAISSCAGMGEYNCIAMFYDGLHGLKNGKWVKLSDMVDTGLQPFEIYGLLMTTENEFVSLSGAQPELTLLSERDISELKSKKVVKIATCYDTDHELSKLITKYNEENADGDYRIELVSYGESGKTYGEAFDSLKLDMVAGNSPDIVPFSSSMPVDTFGAKEDMFIDLYTFLDSDPDYSREAFLPNILEGLESDGKLLTISPSFSFSTLGAKSVFDGVRENWTVDDMYAAADSLPEGIAFYAATETNPRIAFFDMYSRVSDFVDYENASCSFDSPEFIKLISFCDEYKIGLSVEEYENIVDFTYYSEEFSGVMNNKVLVGDVSCFNFNNLLNAVNGEFGGDMVMVGYPTADSTGCHISASKEYGIMANSQNPDAAWDFLRTIFSDYYYDEIAAREFSVLTERFNADCFECTRDTTYTDTVTGETVTEKRTYTVNASTGESIEIENFTQEECEYYKDIITSAKFVRHDEEVYQICREEVQRFYEGECTAEKAAEVIQNRVTIYLSEHYQ